MKMKSIVHHITAILLTAAALCCSCSRSALEHNRGVVVSAVFSDTEDLGTQVSDLQLQFYNSSTGELALQSSFESAQELSLKIFSLPKGEYTVVLGANLSTPLSLEGTSSPSNLRYSLEGVSPVQAFSACGDHNIDNPNHLLEIKMDMKRVLLTGLILLSKRSMLPTASTLPVRVMTAAMAPLRKASSKVPFRLSA